VILQHPTVIDTAHLTADAQTVSLFGITGISGQPAQGLRDYIAGDGDLVTCQLQSRSEYSCLLADGADVAAAALRNGVAQARADAPDFYREQESLARDERRGVWASLPPPPVTVRHPQVVNTAMLTADGQAYRLGGIQGLGNRYAADFQFYIAANGDSLTCTPQGAEGEYVCLLPDGTDVAEAALVNGAARVAADAPDAYRVEQGDALTNRRGYWHDPPRDVMVAMSAPPLPTAPSTYVLAPGDDGTDGIMYVGGAPAAVIGGETVFLAFGGATGWGYWDHYHHWHGAPPAYAEHMEHYHPGGAGLHGYGGPHPASYGGAHPPPPGHPPGFVRPASSPPASHPPPPASCPPGRYC
jgi:endonuclease YncB( thermonuclease family)